MLEDTPLEKWIDLKNQIMASSSFLNDDDSLEKV